MKLKNKIISNMNKHNDVFSKGECDLGKYKGQPFEIKKIRKKVTRPTIYGKRNSGTILSYAQFRYYSTK